MKNKDEILKDVLPSANYLIDSNLKIMKENDNIIDKRLNTIKVGLNYKIKLICKNSYEYLINKKLLFEENGQDEEFSLFSFKFQNIKEDIEIKSNVNEFIECVTKLSEEDNSSIVIMNHKQDQINNAFKLCKKNCLFDKLAEVGVSDKVIGENEIISCLNDCLSHVKSMHQEFTKDYLLILDKLNSKYI